MKRAAIAIADDDPVFAGYLQAFLSLRGHDTRIFARGDELVAALRQGDLVDLVLLDVMMPGVDGLATLRVLKAARPELPVVMLSGREHAATIVEAVQLGAADYVVKPDEPGGLQEVALESAIAHAIEKGPLVSSALGVPPQRSDDPDQVVWGRSEKMAAISRVIRQVADSGVTVLIRGESGVGKELVARALHEQSGRRTRPFVKVNCAALPADLLESELFGHERGAFTGAVATRVGKFEQASGGTIFLDEIGDMTPALQSKLLHVLQDAEFTKLGSNKPVTVDVRVVAATNRDLEAMLLEGDFREDLYYRLKVIEIEVPPLRDRREEILPLAEFFRVRSARRYNRPLRPLSDALRQQFATYGWPGNVRELENLVKRIVVLQDEQSVVQELARGPERGETLVLAATSSPSEPAAPDGRPAPMPFAEGATALDAAPWDEVDPSPDVAAIVAAKTLGEVSKAAAIGAERAAIESTLQQVKWNRRKAAVQLRVSYKTLLHKIRECGIGPS